jgi:3-oxoacyl-[acyl-carrier-protein] synthase III
MCGIQTRRVVAAEESVCDLAERAAQACLQDAGITADKLGAIIACTGTPHRQFPGVSAEVQKRLNAPGIPAFDLHLASISGLFGVALANKMCEQWGPTLVVAAETMTRCLAQGPRAKETAILFGDGAGACLVTPGDSPLAIRGYLRRQRRHVLRSPAHGFWLDPSDGRPHHHHARRAQAGPSRGGIAGKDIPCAVDQVGLFLFPPGQPEAARKAHEGA